MSDENSAELTFEFSVNGKAAGTTVTARIGDDILGCDRFDLAKAKSRGQFVDQICNDRPGINRDQVEKVLRDQAAQFARKQAEKDEGPEPPESESLLARMPQDVRDEARAMLESPDLAKSIIRDVQACGVAGESQLVMTIYLVGTSRLLPRPLSAIIQSPSSTGKSYTIDRTTEHFPPETVVRATAITENALYYMQANSLRHKLIISGERSRREDDDSADATRALRELQASGKLSKMVPVKEGSEIVTKLIELEGPIAYIASTSQTSIFDEDANRCLLLSADERPEQTKKIVHQLAAAYSGVAGSDAKSITQRHHALQRMIRQIPVIVPFAGKVAELFPMDRVEARRAFPHLMGMIQANALLHQYHRQLDPDGRVIAHPDDYQIARHLCLAPIGRLLGGAISGAAIRFYDRVANWTSDRFTTTEAAKHDKKTTKVVRDWLKELSEAGAAELIEEGKGSKPGVWRLIEIDSRELATSDLGLPETICET